MILYWTKYSELLMFLKILVNIISHFTLLFNVIYNLLYINFVTKTAICAKRLCAQSYCAKWLCIYIYICNMSLWGKKLCWVSPRPLYSIITVTVTLGITQMCTSNSDVYLNSCIGTLYIPYVLEYTVVNSSLFLLCSNIKLLIYTNTNF